MVTWSCQELTVRLVIMEQLPCQHCEINPLVISKCFLLGNIETSEEFGDICIWGLPWKASGAYHSIIINIICFIAVTRKMILSTINLHVTLLRKRTEIGFWPDRLLPKPSWKWEFPRTISWKDIKRTRKRQSITVVKCSPFPVVRVTPQSNEVDHIWATVFISPWGSKSIRDDQDTASSRVKYIWCYIMSRR